MNKVSLFVRLWVEILCGSRIFLPDTRQPLREAVSWNSTDYLYTSGQVVSLFVRLWVEMWLMCWTHLPLHRQPLREAVSWNVNNQIQADLADVSLFVRLWVEMRPQRDSCRRRRSASSWGCELKFSHISFCCKIPGQPLREAVSWNAPNFGEIKEIAVSLFVRLWVEMPGLAVAWIFRIHVSLFVRLWVEMPVPWSWSALLPVSLFVRLWVEILRRTWAYLMQAVSLFVRLWVEISI